MVISFVGILLNRNLLSEFIWLVASTHLKNISQIGSFPRVEVNIKKN